MLHLESVGPREDSCSRGWLHSNALLQHPVRLTAGLACIPPTPPTGASANSQARAEQAPSYHPLQTQQQHKRHVLRNLEHWIANQLSHMMELDDLSR
jgi:hypothetical protein